MLTRSNKTCRTFDTFDSELIYCYLRISRIFLLHLVYNPEFVYNVFTRRKYLNLFNILTRNIHLFIQGTSEKLKYQINFNIMPRIYCSFNFK